VILLDLMMPVMDGWTFAREWQTRPDHDRRRVVVFSALARSDPRIVQVPAADYVPKPVTLTRLLEVVARHCRAA
jgi:CheY-like chemotaxis protein